MPALSVEIQRAPSPADVVTIAWITTKPSKGVPLSVFAGALASNPSAAVVAARSEGRRGGFVECPVSELQPEFSPLRESPIGAVVPLRARDAAIGIVIDRISDPIDLASG